MSYTVTPLLRIAEPQSTPLEAYSKPSPEHRVDRIEKESLDDVKIVLPAARQAEYKIKVIREIAKIRSRIAEMRSEGQTEYAINRVVTGLFQDFYHSIASFTEKSIQYDKNKAGVASRIDAVGKKLNQYTPDSRPIQRGKIDKKIQEVIAEVRNTMEKIDSILEELETN